MLKTNSSGALFKHCLLLIASIHLLMLIPSMIYDIFIYWPQIEQLQQQNKDYELISFISPTHYIYVAHFLINLFVTPLLLVGLAIKHYRKTRWFVFRAYTAAMLGAVLLGFAVWMVTFFYGGGADVEPAALLLPLGVQGIVVLTATGIMHFRCR